MAEANLLLANSFKMARNTLPTISIPENSAISWFAPPIGLQKLNCDATCFAYKECIELAWVGKDNAGKLIGVCT